MVKQHFVSICPHVHPPVCQSVRLPEEQGYTVLRMSLAFNTSAEILLLLLRLLLQTAISGRGSRDEAAGNYTALRKHSVLVTGLVRRVNSNSVKFKFSEANF